MDLTEFNIEAGVDSSSGGERIKPGRYNLEYKGSDMIEGANGWKALKIMFDIDGEVISVNHAFTMAHDTSVKAVEIGKQSLSMMFNAMGVSTIKNTDELVNKKVSVELVYGEKGYLEIKDDFGKSWGEATKPGVKPAPVVDETEMFPPDAEDDESDMPF
tara:strand:+ start:220 stop:696 length:477 start_codon:yes stop_codon:yes gene_type:complete